MQEQNREIEIGKAVFTRNFNQSTDEILDENKRRTLESQDWFISYSVYEFEKWNEIFPCIKSSSCTSLWLDRNYQSNMIKEIAHISFSQLKTLSLMFNQIKSIETISFLNMDSLEKLDLKINLVSNLKALNKCKFAQLKILDLTQNLYKQLQVTRMKMKEVEDLDLNRRGAKIGYQNIGVDMIFVNLYKIQKEQPNSEDQEYDSDF